MANFKFPSWAKKSRLPYIELSPGHLLVGRGHLHRHGKNDPQHDGDEKEGGPVIKPKNSFR